MIKTLEVKQFQCHEYRKWDLSPGVNVFVGKSGQGKSAGAVRPLKLLVFNKPTGEGYRRWGSKETGVSATLDDGREVSRVRGDKDNLYTLGDQEFQGFGQGVPESVANALNMGPLNFGFQHDPLFLLASSPTEVAKVLNELAGLDQIDETYATIGKRLYSDRQEVITLEARKRELQVSLKRYDALPRLEAAALAIKSQEEDAGRMAEEVDRLRYIADGLAGCRRQLLRYAKVGELQTRIETAQVRLDKVEVLASHVERLRELGSGLIEVVDRADRLGKPLKILQGKVEKLVGEDPSNRLRDLDRDILRLKQLQMHLTDVESKARAVDLELEKRQAEWDAAKPDTCPLCGKEW
jgi:hypothetical protein